MDSSRTTQGLTAEYQDFAPPHLNAAARMFIDIFNSPPWNDNWTTVSAHERLNSIMCSYGYIGFAAFANNQLIGFAAGNIEPFYDGNTFYLREIAVAPQYQRTGIGKALLDRTLTVAASKDVQRSYLLTRNDVAAYEVYLNWGFKDIAPLRAMVLKI